MAYPEMDFGNERDGTCWIEDWSIYTLYLFGARYLENLSLERPSVVI